MGNIESFELKSGRHLVLTKGSELIARENVQRVLQDIIESTPTDMSKDLVQKAKLNFTKNPYTTTPK